MLIIYLWGGCLCICLELGGFVVKPTLVLFIYGGSQGFAASGQGSVRAAPSHRGGWTGDRWGNPPPLFNIFIIDLKKPYNRPGLLSLLWPQKQLKGRTFPYLGHH